MEQLLLNSRNQKILDHITLDYVHHKPISVGDRLMTHLSSTSLNFHNEILKKWMLQGSIPDCYEIFQMLQSTDIFEACMEFVKSYQAMIFQIQRLSFSNTPHGVFYSPMNLSEIEKGYFRLWVEYFQVSQGYLEICQEKTNQDIAFYHNDASIQEFLNKEQISDDIYIRSIVKKYPDVF